MGGHTRQTWTAVSPEELQYYQEKALGVGAEWQRGLTCLKSQPALVTGTLGFRFMECERLPKAMALRDVRVAWGGREKRA